LGNVKGFVIGDLSSRLPNYNYNDYEHLMSIDGEFAGHFKFECIQIISNYQKDIMSIIYKQNFKKNNTKFN
jgi:hypothetical protein